MSEEIKDEKAKKAILKDVSALQKDSSLWLDRSPDGKAALAFFDPEDVAQGHGIWATRCAVLKEKDRLDTMLGWASACPGVDGLSLWAPDSGHAAIAMGDRIVIWKRAQRKFAVVSLQLGWAKNPGFSWDGEALTVRNFSYVYPKRGTSQVGRCKTGTAVIRLSQLDFFPRDHVSTIAAIAATQPSLTPELFND